LERKKCQFLKDIDHFPQLIARILAILIFTRSFPAMASFLGRSTNKLLRRCFQVLSLALVAGSVAPVAADELSDIQMLVRNRDFPQAMQKVDFYLVGKPRDPQARFMRGVILNGMGQYNEAIGQFSQLAADYPDMPEPYNNLAVLYAQQKDYDKARAALEAAIRVRPGYGIAYENLGDVYAKLAAQSYGRAVQVDKGNAQAQGKLGLAQNLVLALSTPSAIAPPLPTMASTAQSAAYAQPAAYPQPQAMVPVAVQQAAPNLPPAAKAPVGATPEQMEQFKAVIAAWAEAWSNKNMQAYFAAYAPSFQPPRGVPRQEWEIERQARIAGKPGAIKVGFEALAVEVRGDTATANFRQLYRSAGLNAVDNKTLEFVRIGTNWLIQEERLR
jgi:tetratricopeptide (TPR) repeat protein